MAEVAPNSSLMADPIRPPFLKLEGVTKRYGGVTALADVDFACSLGTIHAVVGENGAGKSSLMKIIAGVIRPDEGRIYLDEKPVHFASPADATRQGIACISRNCRFFLISRSRTTSSLPIRRNVLD